jgi:tetratricopeptide (TPR) repeat protein
MPLPLRPASACLSILFLVYPAAASRAQMQMPACHAMPANGAPVAPEALPPAEKIDGIGNLHFAISSRNPETQAWFDQGINLIFDYWEYEANRAFEQAVRTDPNCAICHWGLTQSLGIRNEEMAGYAHDELEKAIALRSHADKRERMYIDAARAAAETGSESGKHSGEDAAQAILRKIIQKYPQDLTARLMLSEEIGDGYDDQGKPRKGTEERIALIQGVLKMAPDNSAANHLWIHAVEASPHPEQALQSAADLGRLAPSSGHMTHMPGHIFYRTGDYARAQASFDLSTSVDEAYMQTMHVAVDDDWNYVHNLMYSIANLLEMGQMERAGQMSAKLPAARGARADTLYPWSTRDAITRLNPALPVAMRTSDWPQVEAMLDKAPETPSQPNLQRLKVGLTAYARGMQAAQSNQLEEANRQSAELDAQLWRGAEKIAEDEAAEKKDTPAPANAKPENKAQPTDPNLPSMQKNLAILSLELRSAILIAQGKYAEAKPLLAQAIGKEKDLGYREPPAFIRPVAEQEAELLMAAGQTAEAETAWKQALSDRPNSGFPLYGLAQVAEHSGDVARARGAYEQFLSAWKTADASMPELKYAQHWMAEHPEPGVQAMAKTGGD